MRSLPTRIALVLLVVAVFAGLQLLGGPHPSGTAWALAGAILLGAWLGWALRLAWFYPARLGEAEVLWAAGAPASEVAERLSPASLATGELGYRIHLLQAMAHLSLG